MINVLASVSQVNRQLRDGKNLVRVRFVRNNDQFPCNTAKHVNVSDLSVILSSQNIALAKIGPSKMHNKVSLLKNIISFVVYIESCTSTKMAAFRICLLLLPPLKQLG